MTFKVYIIMKYTLMAVYNNKFMNTLFIIMTFKVHIRNTLMIILIKLYLIDNVIIMTYKIYM